MAVTEHNILIIDDDAEVRQMIADILNDEGYSAHQATDFKSAEPILQQNTISLIFLDLWIGENEYDGIAILEKLKKKYSSIPVIMISGHGNIEVAVKAIKYGAYDFIEKPFVIERMLITAARAIESATLKSETVNLKRRKHGSDVVLVGTSSYMSKLRTQAVKASTVNSMICILSAKGGGADDLAWLIHCNSPRKEKRFVTFDCSNPDQDAVHDELFGSSPINRGLIKNVNGGTLFLNNIFELNKTNQQMLLKYLQTGKVNDVNADTRIICNSYNANIDELTESGKVERELIYRLSSTCLEIKPLQSRGQDIEHIIEYFYKNAFVIFGIANPPTLSDRAKDLLMTYSWPGNIRQIKNVLENLFLTVQGTEITVSHLPKELFIAQEKIESSFSDYLDLPLKDARDLFEKGYILHQLTKFNHNMAKVANFIGMDRSAFYKKVKYLDIDIN